MCDGGLLPPALDPPLLEQAAAARPTAATPTPARAIRVMRMIYLSLDRLTFDHRGFAATGDTVHRG
jgi:hypothetical protein